MSLKFKKETEQFDRQRFYIEVERVDLIENEDPIADDLMERFIKKRMGLVKKLKDFRKSQNSKRIWTRHRFSMLKGVRKWHKSLAGKKFHRQLGRFLATRITDSLDEMLVERYETLKALSSLRTHIYIEGEYFRPTVDDDVEFELLFEYAVPLLSELELKLLENRFSEINEDEIEIVFRLIGDEPVIESLSELLNKNVDDLTIMARANEVNEDLTFGMSAKYYKLIENELQVDNLKNLMEINEF